MYQLSFIRHKKSTFNLPMDLHKRLKIAAAEQGRDMTEIVISALQEYLEGQVHRLETR